MSRKLIYVPIIHTQADMGAFKGSIERVTTQKFGADGWQRHIQAVSQVWDKIEQALDDMFFDYPKVKLYQDGLPLCDKVEEIVKTLADKGSRNHQLLFLLKQKGASLVGTESAEFLLEEYRRVKQLLSVTDYQEIVKLEEEQKELGQVLLKKRDRFIAEQINNTLQDGETGILFIGMLHNLDGLLSGDIETINLMKTGEKKN